MLYAPGKEYIVYSYQLHNGKKRVEAFFPYCRYPTRESIRKRFQSKKCHIVHDLSDDSWYFRNERAQQLGRFVSCGDRLLTNYHPEGDFHQSREFEFERPRVSALTRGERGFTCLVTENPLREPDADHDESTDSGDGDYPSPHSECFEYED